MSICCVWCLPQMTPLDVALKRGHEKTEEFLRGAGVSHVSTHVRVQCCQQIRCLAVPDWAIFCRVFRPHYCIRSALVQNFCQGWRMHESMNTNCIWTLPITEQSVPWCFECSEVCSSGIMFNFYMGLAYVELISVCTKFHICWLLLHNWRVVSSGGAPTGTFTSFLSYKLE